MPSAEIVDRFLEIVRTDDAVGTTRFSGEIPSLSPEAGRLLRAIRTVERAAAGQSSQLKTGEQESVPLQVGPYQVLRQLGAGGMGEVYAVHDAKLDRVVALKRIRRRFLDRCPQPEAEILRFIAEARSAAALNHQHIVKVFSVGDTAAHQDQQQPYFLMELIEGVGLDHVIRDLEDRLPLQPALFRSPVQTALQLQGKETVQLVPADDLTKPAGHSDVASAANAVEVPELISSSTETAVEGGLLRGAAFVREVAVIGRDAADALSHAHQKGMIHRDIKPHNLMIDCSGRVIVVDFGLAKVLTDDGNTTQDSRGTASYMAPERRWSPADERSDIFALGVTLHKLVQAAKACSVSQDLNAVIERARHPVPEQRYQTAEELRDELTRIINGRPVMARPLNLPQRLFRWSWMNPLATIVCALVLVLLAFFVERAMTKSRQAEVQRQLRIEKDEQARQAVASAEEARMATLASEKYHYHAQIQLADQAFWQGRFSDVAAALAEAPASQSGWETERLNSLMTRQPVTTAVYGHGFWGYLAAAANDEKSLLVTADASGEVLLQELSSGRILKRLRYSCGQSPGDRSLHYYEQPFATADRAGETETAIEDAGNDVSKDITLDVAWIPGTSEVVLVTLHGKVSILDTHTLDERPVVVGSDSLYCVDASAADGTILFGSADGRLQLVSPDGTLIADTRPNGVAVSEILAMDSGWLVGRTDGSLELRDFETLIQQIQISLPGPIWSLDATQVDGWQMIAVGCNSMSPVMLTYQDQQSTLQRLETISNNNLTSNSTHLVRFSKDGRNLFSVTADGELQYRDSFSGQILWSTRLIVSDTRPQRIMRTYSVNASGREPLHHFLRKAVQLLPVDDGRILTVTADAAVRILDITHAGGSYDTELDHNFGPDPCIAFDAKDDNLLWIMATSGKLFAVNSADNRILASVQAHTAGHTDLLALTSTANDAGSGSGTRTVQPASGQMGTSGQICTTGPDGKIRYWTLQFNAGDSQEIPSQISANTTADACSIMTAETYPEIQAQEPLLHLAATPTGGFIAAVGQSADLWVWQMDSGQQPQHFPGHETQDKGFTPSTGSHRIRTGKLAFSHDGSLLAAFGRQQQSHVLRWSETQKCYVPNAEKFPLAGYGGTSLLLPESFPGAVLVADDLPRYGVFSLNGNPVGAKSRLQRHTEATCVDLKATHDGRRILALQTDRILKVLNASDLQLLSHFPVALQRPCLMSLNQSDTLLAVADQSGIVRLMRNSEQKSILPSSAMPEITDVSSDWQFRELLPPTDARLNCQPVGFEVDSEGRILAAAVEADPAEFAEEGRLLYFEEQPAGVTPGFRREVIEVDGTLFDRRMRRTAVALVTEHGQTPVIFFRRRTGTTDHYANTVHRAIRQGDQDWVFETVEVGNSSGFFPLPVADSRGEFSGLLHFTFDGYRLLYSQRADDGSKWTTRKISQQGLGLNLTGHDTSFGQHFIYRRNRYNGDPLKTQYGVFRDGNMAIVPVAADQHASGIAVSEDGYPTVVVWESRLPDSRGKLKQYRDNRWTDYCRLPECIHHDMFHSRFNSGVQIGFHGEVLFLTQLNANSLCLWEGNSGHWQRQRIAIPNTPSSPNFAKLILTSDHQRVIVYGRLGDTTSWLHAARTKKLSGSSP